MTNAYDEPEQPELLPGLVRAQARAARERAHQPEPLDESVDNPVARVLVDRPRAHLDRPFDYAVPAKLADSAVPGARVKVRFAGQDVDGDVVERASSTDHTGTLTPLRRVVSAEPVLAPEVARLTAEVAARYAGRARTCCGSRSRRGTPPPRRSRAHPRHRSRPRRRRGSGPT